VCPPHWHEQTDEAFFVLEGTVRFELDGETTDVQAGGYARVPPGVVHRTRFRRRLYPSVLR